MSENIKTHTCAVLTEGGGEGYAGVSLHLRGSSRGVQDPEGDPADYWSAAEEQHPSTGPGPGLCPPPTGLPHSLHITHTFC